jgi:type II secretory pathway pseudopilin PulG
MKSKAAQGFTLVEAIFSVFIIGIIAVSSRTMLMSSLPNMRLKAATRDIFYAVTQTKTQALRRGSPAALVFGSPLAPLADPRVPVNSYAIFLDNGDGGGIAANGIIDGAEPIIVGVTALPEGISFDPESDSGTSTRKNAVVFSSRGIPVKNENGGLVSSRIGLRATDSAGNTVERIVAVSIAGQIKII